MSKSRFIKNEADILAIDFWNGKLPTPSQPLPRTNFKAKNVDF